MIKAPEMTENEQRRMAKYDIRAAIIADIRARFNCRLSAYNDQAIYLLYTSNGFDIHAATRAANC